MMYHRTSRAIYWTQLFMLKGERRDTRGTILPRRNGHLWYLKRGTLVHARGRATTLES